MDFSMLGNGTGKKGKDDKKGKGKGKAKTTKHFLGNCLVCKAWGNAMLVG